MLHHLPRVTGLLAILASLALVPGAVAATPTKAPAGSKAKERAYGKHCGAKSKRPARAAQRTKCLEAMAKLASGRSSSPSTACRGLSKKKVKGERKSAYARCVSEGAKLLKAKKRAQGGAAGDDDSEADDESVDEGAGDDVDDGVQPLEGDDPGDPGATDDDAPADPGDGE